MTDMNDEALFTYYRGRGRMQVVPRNTKGWVSLVIYLAIILAPTLPMALLGDDISPWIIASYLLLTLVITILYLRWAISRSQRVDLDDIDRNYPDYLEWKRRKGRD
jgi:hypothetical protein